MTRLTGTPCAHGVVGPWCALCALDAVASPPAPLTHDQLVRVAKEYCAARDASDPCDFPRHWPEHMPTAACMDAWRIAFAKVLAS